MIHRPRLYHATALACGLLFGLGLAISGMIHPAKVKAFLDIGAIPSGGWDPSLAIVLGAAVFVAMIAVRVAHRRRRPVAAQAFSQPALRKIDGELVIGSALFGIGWGLAGLCPGPAIADIAMAFPYILLFLIPMGIGSFLVKLWRRLGPFGTTEAGDMQK